MTLRYPLTMACMWFDGTQGFTPSQRRKNRKELCGFQCRALHGVTTSSCLGMGAGGGIVLVPHNRQRNGRRHLERHTVWSPTELGWWALFIGQKK